MICLLDRSSCRCHRRRIIYIFFPSFLVGLLLHLHLHLHLPCDLVKKSQVSRLLVVGVHGRSSTTELLNTIGIPYCQIIAAQESYYHCGWRLLSEASTCMKPSRDQVKALKREILLTAWILKLKKKNDPSPNYIWVYISPGMRACKSKDRCIQLEWLKITTVRKETTDPTAITRMGQRSGTRRRPDSIQLVASSISSHAGRPFVSPPRPAGRWWPDRSGTSLPLRPEKREQNQKARAGVGGPIDRDAK
jgi:hypothetical protein